MKASANPEDYLPLTPPVYQILLTMGDSVMHGYGIIQEFEAQTGQVGALLPGSLYNTISRMLKAGLIVESDRRPDPAEDDDRRRYYEVTPLGMQVARAESERLRSLLQLARSRKLAGEEAEATA